GPAPWRCGKNRRLRPQRRQRPAAIPGDGSCGASRIHVSIQIVATSPCARHGFPASNEMDETNDRQMGSCCSRAAPAARWSTVTGAPGFMALALREAEAAAALGEVPVGAVVVHDGVVVAAAGNRTLALNEPT